MKIKKKKARETLKKVKEIARFRRDIFGVVNEIYVANTRKLKAFFFGAGRVQCDPFEKKEKKTRKTFLSKNPNVVMNEKKI